MPDEVSPLVLQCPFCRRLDAYQDEHDRHVLDCYARRREDPILPTTIPCAAEVPLSQVE